MAKHSIEHFVADYQHPHDPLSYEALECERSLDFLYERFNELTDNLTPDGSFLLEAHQIPSTPTIDAHLHEAYKKEVDSDTGISIILGYNPDSKQFHVQQLAAAFAGRSDEQAFVHITPDAQSQNFTTTYIDPSAPALAKDRVKTSQMSSEAVTAMTSSMGFMPSAETLTIAPLYNDWVGALAQSVRAGNIGQVTLHEEKILFQQQLPPHSFYWGASNDTVHALITATRTRSFNSIDISENNEQREVIYSISQLYGDSDSEQQFKKATEQRDILSRLDANGQSRFFAYTQANITHEKQTITYNPAISLQKFTPEALERYHKILRVARNTQS